MISNAQFVSEAGVGLQAIRGVGETAAPLRYDGTGRGRTESFRDASDRALTESLAQTNAHVSMSPFRGVCVSIGGRL
ncbi:MAG: hypothetical protein AAGJ31_05545 [Verrucomicrobiota bacterium]